MELKHFMLTFAILFSLIFCAWAGFRIISDISFERNCSDYLKRAGDANTIEMASIEIGRALKYMETNNLNSGYTSILYTTPDEDVEFWYKNVLSTKSELDSLIDTEKNGQVLSPVDKSNQLIKVRETLLDDRDGGTSVTRPSGVSIYPANGISAVIGWISGILCMVFCLLFYIYD